MIAALNTGWAFKRGDLVACLSDTAFEPNWANSTECCPVSLDPPDHPDESLPFLADLSMAIKHRVGCETRDLHLHETAFRLGYGWSPPQRVTKAQVMARQTMDHRRTLSSWYFTDDVVVVGRVRKRCGKRTCSAPSRAC